ncbi:MAG: hypothetical protein V3W14_12600, partial [Candidatus Neomarinimicrobiota bacterium]
MKIKKDILIETYPLRIKAIFAAITLLVAMVAYLYPRFEEHANVTRYSFKEVVETFDIPQTQQFVAPPPPSRPLIPVESLDDDYAEDITIEETDLETFADWEAPPPPPSDGPRVRFIAYDEPPVPIGGFEAILKHLKYPELALAAG